MLLTNSVLTCQCIFASPAPPLLNPALTSTDMTVKEGDPVELLCNATGLPSPTIQWKRQGNALLPVGQETYFVSSV